MQKIIKSFVKTEYTKQGKVVGYTASGAVEVSGASGDSAIMKNVSGETAKVGVSVVVASAGNNDVVVAVGGQRDEPEEVYIRG